MFPEVLANGLLSHSDGLLQLIIGQKKAVHNQTVVDGNRLSDGCLLIFFVRVGASLTATERIVVARPSFLIEVMLSFHLFADMRSVLSIIAFFSYSQ